MAGIVIRRAACKRLLDEAAFGAVDAIYLDAHRATQAWLVCRRWRERPDRDEIARQLQELISASRSAAKTTIRLRAAQAAYFVDGSVVHLTGARPPKVGHVGAVGLNRRTADRLPRLVTPTSAVPWRSASPGDSALSNSDHSLSGTCAAMAPKWSWAIAT